MPRSHASLRWVAITVFVFSAVLNYLDRQVLATMVDIWRTRPEFPFDYSDYGTLLSVFSIAYALSAPFMGLFIDKVGLNRGIGSGRHRGSRRVLQLSGGAIGRDASAFLSRRLRWCGGRCGIGRLGDGRGGCVWRPGG